MTDIPLNLIIFGITSNLAQLKLIPALYDLTEKELLPNNINIIGIARNPKKRPEFIDFLYDSLHSENRHHKHLIKEEVFKRLCNRFVYLDGHMEDSALYTKLNSYKSAKAPLSNNLYYLATYPNLYQVVFEHLDKFSLNRETTGWVRVMVEKPIGNDYKSAKNLNQVLLKYFKEEQVYRLDHYLGKETLQNILTFRFANNIFEHLINKEYLDHIQISALEDFSIGKRGAYYDTIGALKDVGQNHLLQMIAFTSMDKPLQFSNEAITAERTKILTKLVPIKESCVFGQYEGYQNEINVAKDSTTDTFFAFKAFINNSRFAGVPIYVRAGKNLKLTATEISLCFKTPLDTPFTDINAGIKPNILIYRIQPNEGIILNILTKKPGHTQELEQTYMQFCYRDYGPELPDAYERLIADALKGDQTFFNDAKEVEAQWKFIDPLISIRNQPVIYKPGSYGPTESDELIEKDGRKWLEPSMMFCRF